MTSTKNTAEPAPSQTSIPADENQQDSKDSKDIPLEYKSAPQPSHTLPVDEPDAAQTTAPDTTSDSSSVKSENPAKQMGRGLLMIVAAPVALAGAGLYAAGTIVEGSGMLLKGMGSIGKKPFQSVMTASGIWKGKKRS